MKSKTSITGSCSENFWDIASLCNVDKAIVRLVKLRKIPDSRDTLHPLALPLLH
jgi:hypothetical protein